MQGLLEAEGQGKEDVKAERDEDVEAPGAGPPLFNDQEKFDDIQICRWCGEANTSGLEHCSGCKRKILRGKRKARREEMAEEDMVDALRRNFGHKMLDWLVENAGGYCDGYEDIRDQTFTPDD